MLSRTSVFLSLPTTPQPLCPTSSPHRDHRNRRHLFNSLNNHPIPSQIILLQRFPIMSNYLTAQQVVSKMKTLEAALKAKALSAILAILARLDTGVFATDDFLRATKVGIVINRLTRNENKNAAIAKLARKIISKWRATTSNRRMSARLQAINQQHATVSCSRRSTTSRRFKTLTTCKQKVSPSFPKHRIPHEYEGLAPQKMS